MLEKEILELLSSHRQQAHTLYRANKFDASLISFDKALSLSKKLKSKLIEIEILNQKGDVYLVLDKLDDASKLYSQACNTACINGFSKSLHHALCLNNLSRLMYKRRKFSIALQFNNECLKIIESTIPNSAQHGDALSNLGLIYFHLRDFEKALECSRKSLRIIANKAPSSYSHANILNNIGEIYAEMNNFEKAVTYCEQALELMEEISPNGLENFRLLNKIGNFYDKIGDVEVALDYFNTALLYRNSEELSAIPDYYPDFVKNNYDTANSLCKIGRFDEVLSNDLNLINNNQCYKYNCLAISKAVFSSKSRVKNGLELLIEECNSALKVDPNYIDAAIIKFESQYVLLSKLKPENTNQKYLLIKDLLSSYTSINEILKKWQPDTNISDKNFIKSQKSCAVQVANYISNELDDYIDKRKFCSLVQNPIIKLPKKKYDTCVKIYEKVNLIEENLMLVNSLNANLILSHPSNSPQAPKYMVLKELGNDFLLPLGA